MMHESLSNVAADKITFLQCCYKKISNLSEVMKIDVLTGDWRPFI